MRKTVVACFLQSPSYKDLSTPVEKHKPRSFRCQDLTEIKGKPM